MSVVQRALTAREHSEKMTKFWLFPLGTAKSSSALIALNYYPSTQQNNDFTSQHSLDATAIRVSCAAISFQVIWCRNFRIFSLQILVCKV